MMKHKFLHTFRQEPPAEFNQTLKQRLDRLPAPTPQPQTAPYPVLRLAQIVTIVAGFIFGPAETEVQEPNVTIIPHDCLDLERVIAEAGYSFSLPTLIPDGLWLESEGMVFSNEYGKAMTFFWRNADGNRPLHLDVSRARPDNNVLLAPGSYEEITVNGRPGIFIYGGWSGNTNDWNRDIVRTVRWEQDGVMYNLVGFQFQESFISDVMLKRIAGSIE